MFGPGTLDPDGLRRSIYFTVKRSHLIPMMVLFDGPDANQGLAERATTTIAPQALLLMNSPFVRRAAEGLARKIDPGPEGAAAAAVRSAYAAALSREPSPAELAGGLEFLAGETESYRSEGKSNARELALADFCQTLLCLNEFIYLE